MKLQNEEKNNSRKGNGKRHDRQKIVRRRENIHVEERRKNGKTKKIRTEERN